MELLLYNTIDCTVQIKKQDKIAEVTGKKKTPGEVPFKMFIKSRTGNRFLSLWI